LETKEITLSSKTSSISGTVDVTLKPGVQDITAEELLELKELNMI